VASSHPVVNHRGHVHLQAVNANRDQRGWC